VCQTASLEPRARRRGKPRRPIAIAHNIDRRGVDHWLDKAVNPADQIGLRQPALDECRRECGADRTTVGLADPDGPAALETDAAARVLLLWGHRPADPSRTCSRVGAETLGRVRSLLAGY